MDRRKFLQGSHGRSERAGGMAGISRRGQSWSPANERGRAVGLPSGQLSDAGMAALVRQPVYFDGYSPPVYPHVTDFDAKRLVDMVLELGGNLLGSNRSATGPITRVKRFVYFRNWAARLDRRSLAGMSSKGRPLLLLHGIWSSPHGSGLG